MFPETWSVTWQGREILRCGEHANIAIEVDVFGKCPSVTQSEIGPFSEQNFRLHISFGTRMYKQVIVELDAPKHGRVICTKSDRIKNKTKFNRIKVDMF